MLTGTTYLLLRLQRTHRKLQAAGMQLGMMTFALDHINEAVYLVDTDFRIIYVNEEACRALGYSRKELLAMNVCEIDPDIGSEDMAQMKEKIDRGGTLTVERCHKTKSGRIFPVEMFTAVFVYAGQSTGISLVRDITARKQVERDLEESRAQLRGLAAHLEEAREQERRRIAREVHDELGQILTALQLNVAALAYKAASDSPTLCELSQETAMLTDQALAVVRNVALSLRPVVLDMGIAAALEWQVRRFASQTGIRCDKHVRGNDIQLYEAHAIALFRIVQEALTNVARHAKAERVDVSLDMDGIDYVLKVRDNGMGFDTGASKADSFGLIGIRERALMLGGTVFINSDSGEGTEMMVRIPAPGKGEKS
jgi:PAS domain S-box-containing protein